MKNTQITTSTHTQMNAPLNLTGQFLIATPLQRGDAFDKTVIYICEHNDNGALGIVVNRTSEIALAEVLSKLEVADENAIQFSPRAHDAVLLGGPVQTERGFVLHAPFQEYAATIKINDRLGLTSSRDVLEEVARGQGPKHMILALGYAGWGAGQLEAEIARNAWLNVAASEHVLFETLPRERYSQAMRLLGFDVAMLSEQTGRA